VGFPLADQGSYCRGEILPGFSIERTGKIMRNLSKVFIVTLLGMMAYGCSEEEASQSMENVGGAFDNAVGEFGFAAVDALEIASDAASGAIDSSESALDDAMDAGSEIVDDAMGAVEGAADDAMDASNEMLNDVKDAADDAADDMADKAKDVMNN